jgi:hypothetical protein
MHSRVRSGAVGILVVVLVAIGSMAATPAPGDRSIVRFRIGEAVLQDWLRVVTPFTVSVGAAPLRTDLTFSEPRGLTLSAGRAAFQVRVRGKALAIDQTLAPVVTLRHDARLNRFALVVSSLPLTLPGLGTIDLKDALPPFEIPALLDHLWDRRDRPIGIHLGIRRVAILDQAVEIEADASVRAVPVSPAAAGRDAATPPAPPRSGA